MNFETFFVNAVKLAAAPSVSNTPVLELTKQDMSELASYLEEQGIGCTQDNEQEIRFMVNNINFTAIENDKSEDVGLDGKVIEPAKYEAVLDEAQQAEVDKNTDTFGVDNPVDQALSTSAQIADEKHEEAAAQALAGNTAEKIEEQRALAQQQQTQPQPLKKAGKRKS